MDASLIENGQIEPISDLSIDDILACEHKLTDNHEKILKYKTRYINIFKLVAACIFTFVMILIYIAGVYSFSFGVVQAIVMGPFKICYKCPDQMKDLKIIHDGYICRDNNGTSHFYSSSQDNLLKLNTKCYLIKTSIYAAYFSVCGTIISICVLIFIFCFIRYICITYRE